jgi:pimeloyl-ACP methyl ester carboxylesterase
MRSTETATLTAELGLPLLPPRPHPYYELERRTVRVGGSRLGYLDVGAGPPLLLVHGLMTSSYSWRYLIEPLSARYRLLIPDLPGAGISDASPSRSHGPEAMAHVLAGFLDAVEVERAAVVGNSLGGVFALRFALDYAERVERLVIMHSPGFPELRIKAMRALLAVPPVREGFAAYLVKHRNRFVARNVHYATDALSVEEVIEYAGIFESIEGARTFVRILRDALAPAELEHLWARVAERAPACPILLLWAKHDALVPAAFGERYAQRLPGARLTWMDDVSHFMHVDDPDATASILLEFLEG